MQHAIQSRTHDKPANQPLPYAWVERASASILLTTCISVATVTGLLYLIKGGMLPPDLFP